MTGDSQQPLMEEMTARMAEYPWYINNSVDLEIDVRHDAMLMAMASFELQYIIRCTTYQYFCLAPCVCEILW